MAKPEWGQKRACPGCGSRFYDLMRDPIICPNCGATVDPSAFAKTRRSRTSAAKSVAKPAAAAPAATAPAATATEEPAGEEADNAAIAGGEENDKDIIEDASELGEDEDDVSEVVEGVEGGGSDDQ